MRCTSLQGMNIIIQICCFFLTVYTSIWLTIGQPLLPNQKTGVLAILCPSLLHFRNCCRLNLACASCSHVPPIPCICKMGGILWVPAPARDPWEFNNQQMLIIGFEGGEHWDKCSVLSIPLASCTNIIMMLSFNIHLNYANPTQHCHLDWINICLL